MNTVVCFFKAFMSSSRRFPPRGGEGWGFCVHALLADVWGIIVQ